MLVHYALPVLAANIMVIPATWLVNVMLVRTDGGFASMGVIRVVDTLRNLVIYLPTVLLRRLSPCCLTLPLIRSPCERYSAMPSELLRWQYFRWA